MHMITRRGGIGRWGLVVGALSLWAMSGGGRRAQAQAGTSETVSPTWAVVLEARATAEPLLAAGRYREAGVALSKARMQARDREAKAFLRYAGEICKLRESMANGRPGQTLVALDFDDGTIPDSFRDGRDQLRIDREITFGASPGALRIERPNLEKFLLAESYQAFRVAPNTLLTLSFYAHDLAGPKVQINTEIGSVHYFWKGPVTRGAWNTMTFRLALDGSQPLPVGTPVHAVAFVATATSPKAFAVLDEWVVIAHP